MNSDQVKASSTNILVEGKQARVQPLSGADIEALLPLARRAVSWQSAPGVPEVLDALPEALTALSQMSGIPREVLARLHIAALLDFAREFGAAWFAVNGPYLVNEVAPMMQQISEAMVAAGAQFEQAVASVTQKRPAGT